MKSIRANSLNGSKPPIRITFDGKLMLTLLLICVGLIVSWTRYTDMTDQSSKVLEELKRQISQLEVTLKADYDQKFARFEESQRSLSILIQQNRQDIHERCVKKDDYIREIRELKDMNLSIQADIKTIMMCLSKIQAKGENP